VSNFQKVDEMLALHSDMQNRPSPRDLLQSPTELYEGTENVRATEVREGTMRSSARLEQGSWFQKNQISLLYACSVR